jgi:hypothetical protein
MQLQFIFMCEVSFELNETCNLKGHTPSMKTGQGGCRRKIRPKERRNYDRKKGEGGRNKK